MSIFYILSSSFLLLSVLPLVTNVGQNLEYEYSLIFSWLILIIVPLGLIFFPRTLIDKAHSKLIKQVRLEWFAGLFILLCIAISSLTGCIQFLLGTCKCNPSEFWLWFGLNSIPAIVLSLLLSLLVINWRMKYSRKKNLVWLLLFYFLFFADLVFWLWFFPQKRIGHFFFGFLHGPIYDRFLPIDQGIIFIRLAHLFLSLGIFYAALSAFYTKKRILTLIFLLAYCLSFWQSSKYQSVGQGRAHLKKILPQTYEEDQFVVHYVKGKNGRYLNAARNLVIESQFHLSELKKQLQLSKVSKIHIYAYPSSLVKKLAFGGGGTDVTDVYTPSIHIQLTSQIYPSLRHELVHALGSDFGFYGLGFHPNMALTEGLAVALAPELRALDLHEGAYEILKSNKLSSVDTLFSPFFWKVSGARSYTVSGSLVSYLLEYYGGEGLIKLYSGQSFEDAFVKESGQVFNDWRRHIASLSKNKENSILAEAIYRSPGALYEKCTHSKPILRKRAKQGSFLRFRQPSSWDAKKDYNPWLLSLDPDSKSARTKMIFQKSRLLSNNLYEDEPSEISQKIKELQDEISAEMNLPFKYLEDAELQILSSDLWFPFNRKKSMEMLNKLASELKNKNFGEGIFRQVFARLILGQLSLENEKEWRKYLAGWGSLPKRLRSYDTSLSEPWILQYLRLRNRGDVDWKSPQLVEKAFASKVPDGIPSNFNEQWFAFLAKDLLKNGNFHLSSEAWKKASLYSVNGKKKRYQELARMALFFEKHDNIVL